MNKITTRSDLFREYARILDMCEGTNINPFSCIKYASTILDARPTFTGDIILYDFAVAIVENKPVFVGDTLYHKNGSSYRVESIEKHANDKLSFRTIYGKIDGDWIENYIWDKPKSRTFNLNGVELPLPLTNPQKDRPYYCLEFGAYPMNKCYKYEKQEDRDKVVTALINLLEPKDD